MKNLTWILTCALVASFAIGCGKKNKDKGEKDTTETTAPKPGTEVAVPGPGEQPEPKVETPPEPVKKCGKDPCPCKDGTAVPPGDNWTSCELEKDLVVQGQSCKAGRLVFHGDGALEECELAAEKEIEGLPCKPSPLTTAWHANGKLRSCTLAKDAKVDGIAMTAGRNFTLHDDGKMKNAWTEETVELGGYKCTKELRRYKSGKFQACHLVEEVEVHGIKVPAGTSMNLHEDGSLRGMWPAAEIKIDGKTYPKDELLCFENNKPKAGDRSCSMF